MPLLMCGKASRKYWQSGDVACGHESLQTLGASKKQAGPHDGKLKHLKANVRGRVEHPLYVIKKLFRHCKMRYHDLAKNTAQRLTLFGFTNLMLAG